MKKIVVVGMSAASVSFVVKLRSLDKSCEIICFSGEKDIPYNRCFLADFLTGELNSQDLLLKPEAFFEQNNIQIKLNSWVTRVDTQSQFVCVGSEQYAYDYLFLGVGTNPAQPSFIVQARQQGAGNVFNFHTLEDMQLIAKYISTHGVKTACVIGGGLNGIEAVSSLHSLCVAVSIVEGQPTVLSGQVDSQVALWLTEKMRLSGVSVFASRRARKLVQQKRCGNVSYVELETGALISVDMVIVAAGSCVNLDIVHGTGIEVVLGSISVDSNMQTNISTVFAGGDVCLVKDMMSGQLVRSTTWADAMLQGLCAATNVFGAMIASSTNQHSGREYPGVIGLRDSYFFGKDFYACGQTTVLLPDVVEVVAKIDNHVVKKWYLQDDELKGFVLIGDVSGLAEYKRWYVTRKKVKASDFS